jgi:TRAP-type C4-dicarboxylate transport system substrate-binding protein
MKKIAVMMVLFFGCSVFIFGLDRNETSAQQPAKVINWRLASGTPPNDIAHEGAVEFCKLVKERSNGRLNIKVFAANELFKMADNFQSTKKGIVEMMYSPGSYWLGIMPECNWETGLPWTAMSREEEMALMFDEGLVKILREAYAEQNMYYLIPTPTGPRGFMSNRAIRTAADYKGLKARCTGPEADLLKELGGSPVYLTGAEVYTALQLKTVDAASWTMMAWTHMNFKEVAKYYCLPRTANMVVALVTNMDAWKALPEDLKHIMEWTARDWIIYCATHYDAVEKTQENTMESERMVVLPPAEQAIVQKAAFRVWDKVAAMSPRNAKAVEITKNYLKKIGRLK